jgi:hypothetical protein
MVSAALAMAWAPHRPKQPNTTVKSGQGDRGDQKR